MKSKMDARIWALTLVFLLLISVISVSVAMSIGDESEHALVLVYKRGISTEDLMSMSGITVLVEYDEFVLVSLESGNELSGGYLVDTLDNRQDVMLHSHSFNVGEGLPEIPAELSVESYPGAVTQPYIVQFIGPVMDGWQEELMAMGAVPQQYRHRFNLIVEMDPETAKEVSSLDYVNWVGIYQPAYKFDDALLEIPVPLDLEVYTFGNADVLGMAAYLSHMGCEVEVVRGGHLFVRAEPQDIVNIARMSQVLTITPRVTDFEFYNSHATWVTQTGVLDDRKVTDMGVTGVGQMVTVCDSELHTTDGGHEMWYDTVDFGDDHRKVQAYYSIGGALNTGVYHGTHVTGSVLGDAPPYDEYSGNDGNAIGARLIFQDIGTAGGGLQLPSDMYADGWARSYNEGSRSHTNSWGGGTGTQYAGLAVVADQFIWDHKDYNILFAAANDGDNRGGSSHSISQQAEGKNVITVGAVQNYNSHNDMAAFSSRGYAADGRIKPTILHVGGGVTSASRSASGYSSMSGTSMSTPGLAGQVAQVQHYYEGGWYPSGVANPGDGFQPSNALVRATLINGAVEITGTGTHVHDERFPNNDQGYGRSMLDRVLHFEGDDRTLQAFDSLKEGVSLSTGQSWTMNFVVEDDTMPLEVTLAWTDYPGASGADPAIVNDLDLELTTPGGTRYVGNAFTGYSPGYSESNPTSNPWNGPRTGEWDGLNVDENILLIPDENGVETGSYEIKVTAHNVPSGPQPFAVVVSGGLALTAGPSIDLTSPVGGEQWYAGSTETITWSTTEGEGAITGVDLDLSTDGGVSWTTMEQGLPDTGSYTWTIPDESTVEARVRATVHDANDMSGYSTSMDFSIIGDPPLPPSNLNVQHYGEVKEPGETGDYEYDVWNTSFIGPWDETVPVNIFYPTDGEAPYPAIVVAHGFMMNNGHFESWGHYFASWGYVTSVIHMQYARIINSNHTRCAYELLENLKFLEEENSDPNSPIYGLVDVENMGLTGFSLGAKASIMAAQFDVQEGTNLVKAIAPMASAITGQPDPVPDLGLIDIPVQLQAGEVDTIAPPEDNSEVVYDGIPDSPVQYFLIAGANHNQYADRDPVSGGIGDGDATISREEQHRIARKYMTSFFNYYFKGQTEYGEYLYGKYIEDDVDDEVLLFNNFKNVDYTEPDDPEGDDHNLLTWDASPDDPDSVVSYRIYRSEDQTGVYESIASVPADGSSSYEYIDYEMGMADDIFWWYKVHAMDVHGQECDGIGPVQEPGGVSFHMDVDDIPAGDAPIIEITGASEGGVPMVGSKSAVITVNGDSQNVQLSFTDGSSSHTWYQTMTALGTYTASVTLEGASRSDTFDVLVGGVHRVSISPDTAQTVDAGEPIPFSAEAYDAYDNLITDTATDFSWDGADANGLFEETTAGTYDVTATYHGETSPPTTVTVNPGDVESVTISPSTDQTVQAGEDLTFSAEAHDAFGNLVTDAAADFTWTGAGNDGVFNQGSVSEYHVTASYEDISSPTITVTVTPGDAETVVLSPDTPQSITAGDTLSFSASAYDGHGNLITDSASDFTWSGTDASGLFDETTAGTYDVTATYDEVTSSPTTVAVNPGDTDTVTITPEGTITVKVNEDQQFSAVAHDEYGNLITDTVTDFTWSGTDDNGLFNEDTAGTYDVMAAHGGITSSETTVVVEEMSVGVPYFRVTIEDYDEEVVVGNTVSVEYKVTNIGDTEGTQDIVFKVNDAQVDVLSDLTLDPEEVYTGVFTWDAEEVGTHTVEVSCEDTEDSKAVTVTSVPVGAPYFRITITSHDAQVKTGEVVTVAYTVENDGDTEGTQNIAFKVNGVEEEVHSGITLGPEAQETGTFTWTPTEEGTFTLSVSSEESTRNVAVTVSAADDDDDDDTTDDDEPSDPGFLEKNWWLLLVLLIVIILIILVARRKKDEPVEPAEETFEDEEYQEETFEDEDFEDDIIE